MSKLDSEKIIKEVKKVSDSITHYSEKAQVNSLLKQYSDSPDFVAFSSDGKKRNFEDFKKICIEYYDSILKQDVTTIQETFNVINNGLVILSWTGNIHAYFKNGDVMNWKNYGLTSVFKKIAKDWKVIHSHESALPPK